jgi:hypothetical protein
MKIKMDKKMKRIFVIGLLIGLLLVGCSGETSENDGEVAVQATVALPTPTLAAELVVDVPTVAIDPTLPPPVEGDVVVPTATSIVPTPEVVATLAPTAEPAGQAGDIGPEFAGNINPFTGLEVDPAVLAHRPILIKVSNSSAVVRPQSGLSDADFVYEHISEGGITRFTAMFYTNDVSLVGPIRSGRMIDLQLPIWYDAGFGYSGASNEVKWMFKNGGFFEKVVTPDWGHAGFWRNYDIGNPNKPGWETLYTSSESIREQLTARGEDVPPELATNFVFNPTPPAGGRGVTEINVRYGATGVFWQFNAGKYLRWADGDPHMDANNNTQLSADNVVLLYAPHVQTDIIEDSNGSRSIDIQFWGEGPMTLFRDGQEFKGVWKRESFEGMITFWDNAGNRLPLTPGTTWFQVVPSDFTNLITE